jgi:glycosyltransferase involved in cell wall biosynthesis
MRVLWLTWKDRRNPLAGGAEVVNEELAKRLVADGHDVTFIVAGFPGAAAEERRDGFRVVRVGGRFTSYLAAWRYYREHKAELMADVVIDECNTMPYFAGWYTGRPTVLFMHMLCRRIWFYQFAWPLGLVGWLAEPVYLRLLRRAPVVTVSESTRQDLVRQGFNRRDVHVIPQGIELKPLERLDDATKYAQLTVLSLGAMRAMKRTLDQIRAFEIAKHTLPQLRLVIAGDSSDAYGQRVLRAIRQSPYAADIEYRGRVTAEEKTELMQRSHLFLVTSVKEGWGLIITEAASQGTPAVVYNVDGLRDSVRHGQTGLVVAVNTPAGLSASIVGLLRDPERYSRLRQQAWEWSHTNTFERSYHEFLKVVTEAASVAPDQEPTVSSSSQPRRDRAA